MGRLFITVGGEESDNRGAEVGLGGGDSPGQSGGHSPQTPATEVKGDGTPPDGPRYQNRACKYYKLTSDNDGEAFRWTSNYQIISKVYLKKHSTLPLCYSLSAADKKMVTSTMKKMVGPEAE